MSEEINPSILSRVPISISIDDSYFFRVSIKPFKVNDILKGGTLLLKVQIIEIK